MSTEKRIWSKKELVIAYYFAKWDMNGLGISKEELVNGVIGNTTIPSLDMQAANFRHIMGIEGYQLTNASKLMYKVVEELKDKTVTQMRKMVSKIIDKSELDIEVSNRRQNNIKVSLKADALNEFERTNFENQLKARRQHRNLVPVKKNN